MTGLDPAYWLSADEWSALGLSLRVASLSLLISLLPAVGLGWLLARREFAGKFILETLVFLPLVLPPVVPGYWLLRLFSPASGLGYWLAQRGVEVAFTWKGAVIAAAVMGFPLLVQAVRVAVSLVDPRLELAAKTLGASRLRVFLTITLPLSASGLIAGAILSFSRSLGEFGATITFVGNIAGETRTLPLALYSVLNQPESDGPALRLIWLSMGLAVIALLLSNWLTRRAQRRLQPLYPL